MSNWNGWKQLNCNQFFEVKMKNLKVWDWTEKNRYSHGTMNCRLAITYVEGEKFAHYIAQLEPSILDPLIQFVHLIIFHIKLLKQQKSSNFILYQTQHLLLSWNIEKKCFSFVRDEITSKGMKGGRKCWFINDK